MRSFSASVVERAEGRTIEALIVPFNVPTRVSDRGGPRYEEVWREGAFGEQLRSKPKVFVNVEHEQGIGGVVGHGIELREERNGLHGVFVTHDTDDGRKALHLVREGLLTGLSLEAIAAAILVGQPLLRSQGLRQSVRGSASRRRSAAWFSSLACS